MNGASREEARKALQALLTASKAVPQLLPENGNRHDEEGMLRRRLRNDIQLALRRPPSSAKAAEQAAIETQVSKLLEVAASRGHGSPARPPATADVEEDEDEDEDEESLEEVKPAPAPQPIPQRILTRIEEGGMAASLRTQVADARKRLHALDRKVTELTRDLKLGRSEIWTHQQTLSTAEGGIARTLLESASELDSKAREEEVRLEKEERELAQELGDARAKAGRWSSVAKRQDTMLQQEREAHGGNDAHKILARHPAGEVFLPRFSRDDDSDDDEEHYRRARRQWGRQHSGEEVSLGSDDSDDDLQVPRAPNGGSNNDARGVSKDPPPPPPPQHRGTAPPALRMDDDEDSIDSGSSFPTPSSGVNSSPAGSPAGISPSKRSMSGTSPGSNGGTKSMMKGSLHHSDSTSESDEEAGEPVQKKVEAPPLPELKGINNNNNVRRPAALVEDEAEEISSEEGLETSRSV